MVSNLLNNAIKRTPAQRNIQLEQVQDASQVEICVVDDGVGLEPAALERTFYMFAQIDEKKNRRRKEISESASPSPANWLSCMQDRFRRAARASGVAAVIPSR